MVAVTLPSVVAPETLNVLPSVVGPLTVNPLPTTRLLCILTSVVNTTGSFDICIRLYTWCINKFYEDRIQFNYQIISCVVIPLVDFILIILTFLKYNTFYSLHDCETINGQSLTNKYKQYYVYLIDFNYVAEFAWYFSKSLFSFITFIKCNNSNMIVYVKELTI